MSTTDPPPAAPLTAEEIAERKKDRLEQARIHIAHVKRECTPDSPMYGARDFARMIRAVECIEDENAALRDRLVRAEARERSLRDALDGTLIGAEGLWQQTQGAYSVPDPLFEGKWWVKSARVALATPTDGAARAGDAAGASKKGESDGE